MREELGGLDDLEMGDLWHKAKTRTPRSDDPDPRRSPRSRVIAGVVAVVVAAAAFGFVRTAFKDDGPVIAGGPDPATVCPSDSHLDPAYVDLGGFEVKTDVLEQPGVARDQITLLPAAALDYFFTNSEVQLSDAPQDGWRPILEEEDRIVLAAPMPDGKTWYSVTFAKKAGVWSVAGWGAGEPIVTPAQRGAGLHLEWRGDVTYDRRSADTGIWLVNDRPDTWVDDRGEYWAIVNLFDPATGMEVPQAPAAIGGVGRSYRLAPGEAVELPLAFGDLSGVADGTYTAIACVRELALASPVGSVTLIGGLAPSGSPHASTEPAPTESPTGGPAVPSVSPSTGVDRVGIYEAMLRELVGTPNADGSQQIHVSTELCSNLSGNGGCHDRLTPEEQQGLADQLSDLGPVSFLNDGDPLVDVPGGVFLLGPILETPDGLRVEGGFVCGGLCGSGAMYIVVPTGTGYEVSGKDPAYGMWVS